MTRKLTLVPPPPNEPQRPEFDGFYTPEQYEERKQQVEEARRKHNTTVKKQYKTNPDERGPA